MNCYGKTMKARKAPRWGVDNFKWGVRTALQRRGLCRRVKAWKGGEGGHEHVPGKLRPKEGSLGWWKPLGGWRGGGTGWDTWEAQLSGATCTHVTLSLERVMRTGRERVPGPWALQWALPPSCRILQGFWNSALISYWKMEFGAGILTDLLPKALLLTYRKYTWEQVLFLTMWVGGSVLAGANCGHFASCHRRLLSTHESGSCLHAPGPPLLIYNVGTIDTLWLSPSF